jgi:hypothetical protein
MDFADLKPGDEITVRLGQPSKATCRAQVRELRSGFVIGVLWNSIAQRWNNRGRPIVIKPSRVVAYHQPE